MHTTTCLRNWNQNMVIIGTVTRASQNTLIAWCLPQMNLKQFRNCNDWAFFHSFWKVIFKPDCLFCNTEWRKKIREKYVWTTEVSTVFECQGWNTVRETAERKKKTTKSSYVLLSEVLIHLHVEHVFTVAVADNVRETNSLIECKWRKQETQDLEETGMTAVTSIWLKRKSCRTKES